MRACLIVPVPDLRTYVDRGATHHLMLAHLWDIPGYVNFYAERAELGDYIMIDNGAKELGVGLGLNELLGMAKQVGAKEVVLSDVRYEGPATEQRGWEQLQWLTTHEGSCDYELAGRPRIQMVPQGRTPTDWYACLINLLTAYDWCRDSMPGRPMEEPVIAVAYHYEHMFEGGLRFLLDTPEVRGRDVHLLGWARALRPLRGLAEEYGNLRSVDSSRPIVYGKGGLTCTSGWPDYNPMPYPGRDPNYFTESIPGEHYAIVKDNIRFFRAWAGDPAGRSRCLECGSERLHVRNHSMMWHDGDVHCENGHYVRMYDAG